jgi:hypothetical protein
MTGTPCEVPVPRKVIFNDQRDKSFFSTFFISHMGVEVAPQIPTESFLPNHESWISSGELTK